MLCSNSLFIGFYTHLTFPFCFSSFAVHNTVTPEQVLCNGFAECLLYEMVEFWIKWCIFNLENVFFFINFPLTGIKS